MNSKRIDDAGALDAPRKLLGALLFVPRHEADAMADIARIWFEGAQAVSMKQAETAQVAFAAGMRTMNEVNRAVSGLSAEFFRAMVPPMRHPHRPDPGTPTPATVPRHRRKTRQ